jgi:two-component system, LytTR family, sensor kinase
MGMISNPKIDIHLQVDNKELHFSVWNRHNNRASEMKDQSSGIGLPNIKRRLNILYGSNHHLTLINNDDWFMTTLKLKLK